MTDKQWKLTPEEVENFNAKKGYLLQSLDDIAHLLGVESRELYYVINRSELYPEVVQAVREWIA